MADILVAGMYMYLVVGVGIGTGLLIIAISSPGGLDGMNPLLVLGFFLLVMFGWLLGILFMMGAASSSSHE